MMEPKIWRWVLLAAILAFGPAVLLRSWSSPQNASQPAADNSKQNLDRSAPTADQQKANAADLKTTQEIRKSIMADKGLSMYAHNVKVITQDGKVTLRGPVRSAGEKANVESKAAAVAGKENVTSRIDVAAK